MIGYWQLLGWFICWVYYFAHVNQWEMAKMGQGMGFNSHHQPSAVCLKIVPKQPSQTALDLENYDEQGKDA